MATPSTPQNVYTDRVGVEAIMGQCGVDYKLDDDGTTVITSAKEQNLTYAINYASNRIDMYLANRYSPAVLATSWIVWHWASVIAAHTLSKRRCAGASVSLQAEFDQTMSELGQIKTGQLDLGNVPSLASPGASVSNVRLDPTFVTKRMRVEKSISDSTSTSAPVIRDIIDGYQNDSNGNI